jgi:hypothetical protein
VEQRPQEAASSMCTLHSSSTMHRWVAHQRALMFGVARKLTLRASGGSNPLSSYAQAQRPC